MNSMIDAFLTQQERNQIAEAIRQAELHTSGEIVTMIVQRSSQLGQVVWNVWSSFILLVLALYSLWPEHSLMVNLIFLSVGLIAWPIASLLSHSPFVQRIFLSRRDMENQVWSRAEIEFHRHRMGNTKAQTGILIFLSLMEHRCVVFADKGIAAKLESNTWQDVVSLVIQGIRTRQTAAGMVKAVERCGQILRQYFPSDTINVNELENHLILKP